MSDKKYNPFDKKENREYSREEELARFKAGIAYKKTCNYKWEKGRVMITNGKITKLVNADIPIPEGWVRGRADRRGIANEQ